MMPMTPLLFLRASSPKVGASSLGGIGIRQKIRKAYPYMMTVMACLLILRGMGLGIPYVSPKMNEKKAVMIECSAKP